MPVTINPDTEIVEEIKVALEMNEGYCPCRIEKTPDTNCMCKDFRDKVKDENFEGKCHCGLYVKTK